MLIAGVDEAGRGPLAGPLVVAAVILDPARPIIGLADSKVLSAARRDVLFEQILERALDWSIVVIQRSEIDRLNILRATLAGMRDALWQLKTRPDRALIDGKQTPPDPPCPTAAIIDGDASEISIGAASIVAKVSRDRLLVELDRIHPGYGFARHKGYGTREHLAALQLLGPCAEHRRSFAPVRRLLERDLFQALP